MHWLDSELQKINFPILYQEVEGSNPFAPPDSEILQWHGRAIRARLFLAAAVRWP